MIENQTKFRCDKCGIVLEAEPFKGNPKVLPTVLNVKIQAPPGWDVSIEGGCLCPQDARLVVPVTGPLPDNIVDLAEARARGRA